MWLVDMWLVDVDMWLVDVAMWLVDMWICGLWMCGLWMWICGLWLVEMWLVDMWLVDVDMWLMDMSIEVHCTNTGLAQLINFRPCLLDLRPDHGISGHRSFDTQSAQHRIYLGLARTIYL